MVYDKEAHGGQNLGAEHVTKLENQGNVDVSICCKANILIY